MKSPFCLLILLLAAGLPFACSSSEGKFGGNDSGGSPSTSGGTNANPDAVFVDAGEVPLKDFSAAEDGGDALTPSDLFKEIRDNPYGDPNDPCTQVGKWTAGADAIIENGTLVSEGGKVYKYDTTSSSCNKTISYAFDACTPSAPAEWCKPCWVLQDLTCADDPATSTDTTTTTTTDAGA